MAAQHPLSHRHLDMGDRRDAVHSSADTTASAQHPARPPPQRRPSLKRNVSLSNIVIPSHVQFRPQQQYAAGPSPSPSSVKRKPLPATASPQLHRADSADFTRKGDSSSKRSDAPPRSFSVDSPQGQVVAFATGLSPIQSSVYSGDSATSKSRNLDTGQRPVRGLLTGPSPIPSSVYSRDAFQPRTLDSPQVQATAVSNGLSSSVYSRDAFQPRDLDENPHGGTPKEADAPEKLPTYSLPSSPEADNIDVIDTMLSSTLRPDTLPRPTLNLQQTSYHTARSSQDSNISLPTTYKRSVTPVLNALDLHNQPAPKSPSSKIGGWFGWKSSASTNFAGPLSPATPTYSDGALGSPLPSPRIHNPGLLSPTSPHAHSNSYGFRSASTPLSLDIPKANAGAVGAAASARGQAMSYYYTVPGTPGFSRDAAHDQIDELERELREVGAELAHSIRREMELEDELERYKLDNGAVGVVGLAGNRTSDYYSDSGASSVRFPIGDTAEKLEELERIRRRVEQDKATLKVEMGQRLQTEMERRKEVEEQLKNAILADQQRQSQMIQQGNMPPEAHRELERELHDTQRRLREEKDVKQNFEDLVNAMRQELQSLRNERDNLRDEVVPQLKARLDGLEAESANSQKLVYENTKMQQELENVKKQLEGQTEEERDTVNTQPSSTSMSRSISTIGRSRSNTLGRSPSIKALSRPTSIRGMPDGGPPVVDRFKELEDQRDALHAALKSLLKRQEVDMRQHRKQVKALEMERNRALLPSRPRRTSFHSEVRNLRDEVMQLRLRANDALEQKWQCEKGLGGLRMDLDRAHQETNNLRGLLKEHDIPIPSQHGSAIGAADTLDKAYQELRTTHALSLVRALEMESELGSETAQGEQTIALLKQSISSAEAERDAAISSAESYRTQACALQQSEVEHLSEEQSLASELFASAGRMDGLAAQVAKQMDANRELKQRLAEAVGRGEKEQRISAKRIVDTQAKLRELEDHVTSAQQHSEDSLANHEEEVRRLKETHRSQLQRVKPFVLSPTRFSFLRDGSVPQSPLFGVKSPRLNRASSGAARKLAEVSQTVELEKRVRGLEKALKEAEDDMEEVVSRMNKAQIEVAELQAQRDEANMQTRRLHAQIEAERERVKVLMG